MRHTALYDTEQRLEGSDLCCSSNKPLPRPFDGGNIFKYIECTTSLLYVYCHGHAYILLRTCSPPPTLTVYLPRQRGPTQTTSRVEVGILQYNTIEPLTCKVDRSPTLPTSQYKRPGKRKFGRLKGDVPVGSGCNSSTGFNGRC